MTIHTRPDDQIFAAAAEPGELDSFPDLARGWGVTLDATKGIPPMEYFNALQQRTDKAIAYLLQRGVAEWSASTEYPQQAITIKNGQVFFAKQQNANKDPLSNPEIWVNSFGQKANQSDFERLNNSLIGSVQMFAYDGGQAPDDFLWCDGGLYNPQDYPKLFEKIGYTWGRSGSKFATPSNAEDNRFPRCGGGKLTIGMTQGDAIRNLKGTLFAGGGDNHSASLFPDEKSLVSGVFSPRSDLKVTASFKVENIGDSESKKMCRAISFNASNYVSTADENRPNSIVYMFAIKYQ